jgi:hypothetical protein
MAMKTADNGDEKTWVVSGATPSCLKPSKQSITTPDAASLLLSGLLLGLRLLFLHLFLQMGELAGWLAGGLLSAFNHDCSPLCNFTRNSKVRISTNAQVFWYLTKRG